MKNELVSVIIPTYNRKHFLQIAIESVLSQTYTNYELIVVDDGSTDNTREVIREKYWDKLIYIWQENQGESSARNHGLSIAKGNYVAFLDSDDVWCANKLSVQINTLTKPHNEDAVLAYSSAWVINDSGERINSNPVGNGNKRDLELSDLCSGPQIFGPPSNMLIRARYLQELGGFDESIQYGEDWDLVIRLRSKGRFLFIDKPLLYYRVHQHSQQGIPKPDKLSSYLDDALNIINKNADLLFADNRQQSLNQTKGWLFEKVAAWSFVHEKWNQSNSYVIESHKFSNNDSLRIKLASRIGYFKALLLLQELSDTPKVEEYMLNKFIPNIENNWPSVVGVLPKRKLKAVFYQTIAFNLEQVNKNLVRRYCLKAFWYSPRFILSPTTIKVFLRGSK